MQSACGGVGNVVAVTSYENDIFDSIRQIREELFASQHRHRSPSWDDGGDPASLPHPFLILFTKAGDVRMSDSPAFVRFTRRKSAPLSILHSERLFASSPIPRRPPKKLSRTNSASPVPLARTDPLRFREYRAALSDHCGHFYRWVGHVSLWHQHDERWHEEIVRRAYPFTHDRPDLKPFFRVCLSAHLPPWSFSRAVRSWSCWSVWCRPS